MNTAKSDISANEGLVIVAEETGVEITNSGGCLR
jgi:hypothetical protein